MTDKSETKPMLFKVNDEITIMRGLHKGMIGTVRDVSEIAQTYAVKLQDGVLAVINAVNVRVPAEATITATDLADALGSVTEILTQDTLDALENRAPGITDRFVIAKAAA